MKKETKKKTQKESDFEMLARLVVNGFEKMGADISSLKEGQNSLKQGQAKLEQGQARLEQGQARLEHEVVGIKSEVSSIKEEQKDHTRRLISIERKLTGTQISLDETVHRSEFTRLEHRVKALES